MFGIFKPGGRFKATNQDQTQDLSSRFSSLTPHISSTRDPSLSTESRNPRSLPSSWISTRGEEHQTSLVHKIAARFVPNGDFHSNQNGDVSDRRATPLSRGGNPVKQTQLFKGSGDHLQTKSVSEGFISKVTVDQLMSYKTARNPTSEQTSVNTQDWSKNSPQVKNVEGQLETRKVGAEKRMATARKGEESMMKWVEFAAKGEESGKRDHPVLGVLVLVWLINQRELLKDLVELRSKSIDRQKILQSNQDIANTSLTTLAQHLCSLEKSLHKQQQQVHTQMTHLKRLMFLCCLAQLMILISMVTWTNPNVKGKLHTWYRYFVSVSRPTASLLTSWKDASQRLLHRFTANFPQIFYSWPWR